MKKIFEALIHDYLSCKVGISENFLSVILSDNLRENIVTLDKKNLLTEAKIGNEGKVILDHSIRSDKIYWLSRENQNQHENDFFDLIDAFVLYLNQTCYVGISSYEFHYAVFEKGASYVKHVDQFKSNSARQYTMIFYLNQDWKLGDGGELCVYLSDTGQNISPTKGKGVFFKSSDLEHEVLESNFQRLSITGWLRTD
jgi:SM-20-related protein